MKIHDTLYIAMLHSLSGLGQGRLHTIFTQYSCPQSAWEDLSFGWANQFWFSEKIVQSWIQEKETRYLEKFKVFFEKHKIGIKIITDSDYPDKLSNISDPPYIIYYKGEWVNTIFDQTLAVIGSRKITPEYGMRAIKEIVPDLAGSGYTIVSGGALGADTQAHLSALEAGGNTIVVLWSGIDVVYPASNKKLFQDIVQTKGLIVSDYPIGTKPVAGNFPARNRIVSGLSDGVLIVEAAKKSGTMITAQTALDQWRDLFVVPGDIYRETSQGCNSLLSQGVAKAVQCANDILSEYGIKSVQSKLSLLETMDLSDRQQAVLDCLGWKQKHSEEISETLWTHISELSIDLMNLQLEWVVSEAPGGYWYRV